MMSSDFIIVREWDMDDEAYPSFGKEIPLCDALDKDERHTLARLIRSWEKGSRHPGGVISRKGTDVTNKHLYKYYTFILRKVGGRDMPFDESLVDRPITKTGRLSPQLVLNKGLIGSTCFWDWPLIDSVIRYLYSDEYRRDK